MTSKPMKIIALEAENVKRLSAVCIRPQGNLVEITGKNGQGKTSVLDAIWWALEGAKNIHAMPIRKGAKQARIKLDLGELMVTRTFRAQDSGAYTTSIAVETADGVKIGSPQDALNSLLGALSLDPIAFTRMAPADQLDTLKGLVPGFDFAANEQANEVDFKQRTDLNRMAKDLGAQVGAITFTTDEPTERVDEQALIDEMQAAGEHNTQIEARKAARDHVRRDAEVARAQASQKRQIAADLRRRADEADSEAAAHDKAAGTIEDKLATSPALPDPIDTEGLKQEIGKARSTNAAFETAQRRKELQRRLDTVKATADALTAAMEKRKEDMAAAVAAAKFPVPGLALGDTCVMLNGVPFNQGSDAEQLRASIAIAAALNPKLKVVRIRDGSLLDDDAMDALADFADANDLQVWIERVDSSGRVGFVIEDGHLKAQPALQAAE